MQELIHEGYGSCALTPARSNSKGMDTSCVNNCNHWTSVSIMRSIRPGCVEGNTSSFHISPVFLILTLNIKELIHMLLVVRRTMKSIRCMMKGIRSHRITVRGIRMVTVRDRIDVRWNRICIRLGCVWDFGRSVLMNCRTMG